MKLPSKFWLALAVVVLVPLALMLIGRRLDAGFGLSGRYYAGADWQGDAVLRIDREITTRSLNPVPTPAPRQPFSARWDGFLRVDRPGRYVFQLISDDGAWLDIDGRLVIDNGGNHSPLLKEETIHLAAGLHVISLMFFQGAGGWRLELLWAPEGEPPAPLTAPWLLNVPMKGWRHTAASMLHASLPYMPFLWLGAAFLLIIRLGIPVFRHLHLTDHLGDRALHVVLLLSVALNACGIWWGLGWRWAPDEILPSHVLRAIESRFSNGWFGPYPPFHYYVLSLAYVPFLAAERVLGGPIPFPLHLLHRIVSLVMAFGILIACYLCGRALRGRIAGLAAAALTGLLLPFVYYAKIGNLDVPYLFWFSWAMLFYTRIVVTADVAAYAWFAGTAALAIASKDQAFGFFVAPCVHVVALRFRRLAPGSLIGLLRDAVVPRTALVGLVTLVVAYNLPFNWSGFADHVALIRANGSGKYRMVATTLDGQLTLLKYSLSQVRFAFGWPATAFVCVALFSAIRQPDRRTRLWLLLPAVSYYCFFVAPTSIVFDRFVIGICILLAIIAGCAVDDWMRGSSRVRRAAVLCLGGVCAYSAARAASLNALMMTDSRYYVEKWIADKLPRESSVASGSPQSYLPRLEWADTFDLRTAESPTSIPYVVLNATYAQRFDSSSAEGAFYDRIRKGDEFSLVLQYRATRTWPLSRDPVFTDIAEDWFTNLDKVNPLIEVYKLNELAALANR